VVLRVFQPAKKSRGALVGLLLLLCWFLFPPELFGDGAKEEAGKGAKPVAPDFVLTIHDNRLSINAKKASVTQLLAEFGRRMNIEVVAETSAEDKVTLAFDRLSLEEASRGSVTTPTLYISSISRRDQDKTAKSWLFRRGNHRSP
jgi:hypothetical protein